MSLVSCRFAAVLPILTFFSVLAHAQGTTPSQTYLAPATGRAGQIGFAVTVRPWAGVQPPFTTPAGTVTLYNGTTAVGSPATLSAESGITSATFAEAFGTPDASVAKAASGAVWGDFNEDGLPDLLVYGAVSGSQPGLVVQGFLCSGSSLQNGTTTPFTVLAMQQLALPLQTQYGQTLAVLDVDGDGHLDLLAGNTVAYGKGDGTFGRVAVLPVLASGYNQTYAVDIDGDGKMDIVAVDTPPSTLAPGTVQYAFTVFHNAGGGNFNLLGPFQLAPPFAPGSSVYYNIFGLSFADVNGDGRIDVLSQSNSVPPGNAAESPQLNVMLNLGTGFGAPQAIDTSGILDEGIGSIAFTDLNGDGKLDLMFSYQAFDGNNGVATLLGNGDGSFAAPADFTIGNNLSIGSLLPIVTADFNADGKADVVLGSGVLLLGNGDGTLTAVTPLFTSAVTPGNAPPAYAVLTEPPTGSIPGIGTAPLSVLFFINLQAGANAVFVPNLGSSATVTAMLPAGTYSLTAHYSGDAKYAASVSNTVKVTVAPVASKITVTSSATPIYATQSVTFTATLGNPAATGTITFQDAYPGSDPLQPILTPSPTTIGTVTLTNGVATLTTSHLPSGVHTITATYSGDANNLRSTAQLTETVNLPFGVSNSGSVISLTVVPGKSVSTQLSIGALGGFAGPVMFGCRDLTATCSFSPATVNIAGTGATTVTLTVTATRAPTTAQASPGFSQTILACGIPLFALFGVASMGRVRTLFAVIAIALCGISFLGCGGGGQQASSSTSSASLSAGTYPFYVTATSGQNELAINAILTVQ